MKKEKQKTKNEKNEGTILRKQKKEKKNEGYHNPRMLGLMNSRV